MENPLRHKAQRGGRGAVRAFALRVLVSSRVLLAACAFLSFQAQVQAAELRVVSETVGTDEMLLVLARPEQIAALSPIADDPAFSGMASEASKYPKLRVATDAEGVLRFHPTLVLVTDFSRAELVEQLRRAGVRVLSFDRYATLEDAYTNLRTLAQALGPDAEKKAAGIIADCERRVAALDTSLRNAPKVRVIAPSTYGVIPGRATTFQDLCDHAGAVNLAATLGGLTGHEPPPEEKMLTWPIDRVVLTGDSIDEALAVFRKLPPYAFMPAIREGRAVLVEPWQLSCVSHLRVRGYETLAHALHLDLVP